MIATHSSTIVDSADQILPKGDIFELPTGTGRFSLRALFSLLTAGGLVAGLCKWLELEPLWIIILQVYIICWWWCLVQQRARREPRECADQEQLRAEVRRWLERRDSGAGCDAH